MMNSSTSDSVGETLSHPFRPTPPLFKQIKFFNQPSVLLDRRFQKRSTVPDNRTAPTSRSGCRPSHPELCLDVVFYSPSKKKRVFVTHPYNTFHVVFT